jgi:uncharacterized RDD family membrane protein YckC
MTGEPESENPSSQPRPGTQSGGEEPEQPEGRPGSIFLRAAAVLLDSAIIVVIAAAILSGGSIDGRTGLALYLGGSAIYYIGFVLAISATPGKIAMGLFIADQKGDKAEPDKVILRYLVLFVGAIAFGIGTIISIIMVLIDPQRRALHDRIAGTIVLAGRPPLEELRRDRFQ